MKYYKHIKKPIVVQVEDEVIMGENYIEITASEYDALIKKLNSPFDFE